MGAELEPLGHPLVKRTPLDVVLGSAQGRYFGAGYRSVNYSVTPVERAEGIITAIGHVHYPTAWSTNATGSARDPHLSSIDAVLLPVTLLEALMSSCEHRQAGRMRITGLHLAAGAAPFLTLDTVPIRLTLQRAAQGQQVYARVGNIKVGLTMAEEPATIDLRTDRSLDEHATVYSSLFRQVESTSWIRHSGPELGHLVGEHVLTAPPATVPSGGYEALQWPAPTLIDYLVVMGQLTQALVYTAAGRRRSDSGPLWMRTIDIRLDTPPRSLPAHLTTSIELLRDRAITRDGVKLHDCKVRSHASSGVSAVATLAYQES